MPETFPVPLARRQAALDLLKRVLEWKHPTFEVSPGCDVVEVSDRERELVALLKESATKIKEGWAHINVAIDDMPGDWTVEHLERVETLCLSMEILQRSLDIVVREMLTTGLLVTDPHTLVLQPLTDGVCS